MIYLDYNATTPVDPDVLEQMLPWFSERPGNASSVDHLAGNDAAAAVARAREQVGALVGAQANEVVFTSGATEAVNIAILGTLARARAGAEIVVSAVEHPAVMESAAQWGERKRVAAVDPSGVLDLSALAGCLNPATALVCLMAANNETGALQPVQDAGELTNAAEVPMLVDASQAAGRLDCRALLQRASMVALSAHKMSGPKGVGALVVRRRRPRPRLAALQHGGGHERGLRPGTLNVPAIVGMGAAAELAQLRSQSQGDALRALGRQLLGALTEVHPALELNGPKATKDRLPQTLNVLMPGVDAHALVRLVARDLAVSVGSACTTTSVEPSHVLLAAGRSPEQAGQSVRFSWGPETTAEEMRAAAAITSEAVGRLRRLSSAA